MTNEIRKARMTWQKQMSTILEKMLSDSVPTEWATKIEVDEPGFNDCCKFTALRYEIHELKETLENMAKYTEIIMEKEEKK